MKTKILFVSLFAIVLSGCAGMGSTRNGQIGTVTGGVIGGLLGNQIAHGRGKPYGLIGGAVVGSLLGNSIGRSIDRPPSVEYRYIEPPVVHKPIIIHHYYRPKIVCRMVMPYGQNPRHKGTVVCQDQYGHWHIK